MIKINKTSLLLFYLFISFILIRFADACNSSSTDYMNSDEINEIFGESEKYVIVDTLSQYFPQVLVQIIFKYYSSLFYTLYQIMRTRNCSFTDQENKLMGDKESDDETCNYVFSGRQTMRGVKNMMVTYQPPEFKLILSSSSSDISTMRFKEIVVGKNVSGRLTKDFAKLFALNQKYMAVFGYDKGNKALILIASHHNQLMVIEWIGSSFADIMSALLRGNRIYILNNVRFDVYLSVIDLEQKKIRCYLIPVKSVICYRFTVCDDNETLLYYYRLFDEKSIEMLVMDNENDQYFLKKLYCNMEQSNESSYFLYSDIKDGMKKIGKLSVSAVLKDSHDSSRFSVKKLKLLPFNYFEFIK